MAKFAVLFFAALAFQAAFAGVFMRNQMPLGDDLGYGLEGLKSGQLENLAGQLQTVAHDASVSLEAALPNNRQVAKTLIWQSRELAQLMGAVVAKLQIEGSNYSGDNARELEQIVNQLREIQISLQQVSSYTDLISVDQLKNQLNTNIQNAGEQIEKLVRLVQTDLVDTQGSLRAIVRSVVLGYLNIIQQIQIQIQNVAVEGGQSPRQLALKIQEVTNGLTAALQGQVNPEQLKLALREYAQNIEAIIIRLQEIEGIVGNTETNSVVKQLRNKLRRVIVSIRQIIDGGVIESSNLVRELQIVAEEIEQLVQYGSQQTLIQELLGDYLAAIQQARIQIQGGLYGQDVLLSQRPLLLNNAGLLRKNAYQGIYGDLLSQPMLGRSQNGKGLAIQIQVVASELAQILENVHIDNVLVRQTLINLIREYAQELETIVEKLQEVGVLNSGVGMTNPQLIAQKLRQIVVALREIDSTAVSTVELKNQLLVQIQNAANKLQLLVAGMQLEATPVIKKVLVQFLIVTRNLKVQLLNISHVAQRGQTSVGFGSQIETLANGLVAALESISIDNRQSWQFLLAQARELAQHIETIVERLQGSSGITAGRDIEIPQQVAQNLRQMVAALRQVNEIEDITSAQQLRTQLIVIVQDAANEIQKLLWVGQNLQIQGQEQINTVFYKILKDFVAVLQNQQIQLQTIYQSSRYGQNAQQLAIQIQAITNNLAIYLQNVPARGENARQNIEVQARKLAQYIENLVQRLEVEINQANGNGIDLLQQVVRNLKQVVVALEQVTGWETTNSVYGLSYQLNIVLQHVASEMRRLSLMAQSDLYQAEGNLNTVVRSVLVQYLVVLQHVQIELQEINQTVQIGQTPRELALQIQIVARRLTGILRVAIPDDRQTEITLIRQARYLSQIIENILVRLQVQISNGNGNSIALQQVVKNLRQIQLALQQVSSNANIVGVSQLKVQLAVFIQDAAVEIQKLMWVAQSDLQKGQSNINALIKGVLIDFLSGLQNLQLQIQTHLQIVLGGQHPRALAIQIQSVASRLLAFLQWAQLQPNSQQLRQALVIQIGELTQTIDNLVQMIQAQIKNNGENAQVLHEIVAQLTKVSLSLQKLNGAEAKIAVNELSAQLSVLLQEVVAEIERLAYIAQAQLQQNQAANTNGVLHGVLNNILATLRTMLIQLQSTHQFGYGQSIKELANQIQTVSTKLTGSLEIVATGTKQVRQAIAIQTLKYARRVQNIVERLETEVNYNSGIDTNTLQQVSGNLRQISVALQQLGGSLATKTTVELKNQLNNQIQMADAEIQKLLLIQSSIQQRQGMVDIVVKSVLIEYLAAVQNLQIQVQFITQASQKGLTLPQLAILIESVVGDISASLQRVTPANRLVGKTINVEARQLAKVLANIVNKLQSETALSAGRNDVIQQAAGQLKEIQMALQEIAEVTTIVDVQQQKVQLELGVQRAIVAIEQLVYAVQPQLEQAQVGTGIVSTVREVLNEFLLAVQNVQIQIQNVLQNGQTDLYSWGLEGKQARSMEGLYYGQRRMLPSGLELNQGGNLNSGLIPSGKQLLNRIQLLARDLSIALENIDGQQASQVIAVQARELLQIITSIIAQLEDMEGGAVQQVIYKLREVQMTLQRLALYNVLTNAHQLKAEFLNYIEIIVAQIEKLVLTGQQGQGNWQIINNVLTVLVNGLESIQGKIESVAQVGSNLLGRRSGYGLEQLGNQIQIVANQVAEELQTVAVNDIQIRRVVIIQSRQLVQILENIVDRLQVALAYGNGNIVQKVVSQLKQIHLQLQAVANSGAITSVNQIKTQVADFIQEIGSELQQLALVAQSDMQETELVKEVLVQYLVYLRQIQYQLQNGVNQWSAQRPVLSQGLVGSLRGASSNTMYGRQLGLGAGNSAMQPRIIMSPERFESVNSRSMDAGAHYRL